MTNAERILFISIGIALSFAIYSSRTTLPLTATDEGKTAGVVYKVTAYCPCEICCGRFADGLTASGVRAEGLIAAAPPEIPFGTRLDVPGHGVVVVEDRGGAIKGNRLDLLFPTHQEALNWGVQYLEVRVVK